MNKKCRQSVQLIVCAFFDLSHTYFLVFAKWFSLLPNSLTSTVYCRSFGEFAKAVACLAIRIHNECNNAFYFFAEKQI